MILGVSVLLSSKQCYNDCFAANVRFASEVARMLRARAYSRGGEFAKDAVSLVPVCDVLIVV